MSTSEHARVAALLRVIGAIAHDLNNPVQTLFVHASFAAEDAPPGSEEAMVAAGNLRALARMLTILRAFTRLAAAGVDARPLDVALERFADLMRPRFEALGVRVEFDPPAIDAPISAAAEETLLAVGVALASVVRRDPVGATVVQVGGDASEIRVVLHGAGPDRAAQLAEAAAAVTPNEGTHVRSEANAIVLTLARGKP